MSWNIKIGLTLIGAAAAVLLASVALSEIGYVALGMALGVFVCALFPSLDSWLRGAAASVRAWFPRRAAPAAPARFARPPVAAHAESARFRPLPLATVLSGLWGAIELVFRRPLLVLGIAILLAWGLIGTGCIRFPFTKSAADWRVEAQVQGANVETLERVIERNEALAGVGHDVSEQRAMIRLRSERGRHAIDAATPAAETPIDPVLVAAWRDALGELRIYNDPHRAGRDPGSGDA